MCIIDDFWTNMKDVHGRGVIDDDEYYAVTELFSEILDKQNSQHMGEDPIDMEYIRKEAFDFFKHHSKIDQWIGDG